MRQNSLISCCGSTTSSRIFPSLLFFHFLLILIGTLTCLFCCDIEYEKYKKLYFDAVKAGGVPIILGNLLILLDCSSRSQELSLSIENIPKWSEICNWLVKYLETARIGLLLEISEVCPVLSSFLASTKNKKIWSQFVDNLLYSFQYGKFNRSKHDQMFTAGKYLDQHPIYYPSDSKIDKNALPFVFSILPCYTLSVHSKELLNIINSAKSLDVSFLPYVRNSSQYYSNWVTAGISLFCRHASSNENMELLFHFLSGLVSVKPFQKCKEYDCVDLVRIAVNNESYLALLEKVIDKTILYMLCAVFGSGSVLQKSLCLLSESQLKDVCRMCFRYDQIVEFHFSP